VWRFPVSSRKRGQLADFLIRVAISVETAEEEQAISSFCL
jgi:hypothetical protein